MCGHLEITVITTWCENSMNLKNQRWETLIFASFALSVAIRHLGVVVVIIFIAFQLLYDKLHPFFPTYKSLFLSSGQSLRWSSHTFHHIHALSFSSRLFIGDVVEGCAVGIQFKTFQSCGIRSVTCATLRSSDDLLCWQPINQSLTHQI